MTSDDQIRPQGASSAADSVTAVVPFLRDPTRLERCCAALLTGSVPPAAVVVVDNGSGIHLAAAESPRVEILRFADNKGFAAAANLGLVSARTPYVLLVNDDAEVEPSAVETLLAFASDHPRHAAFQPKLLDLADPSHFDYSGGAGGHLDLLGYPFARGRIFDTIEGDRGQYDTPQDVFWASGACLLVRREAALRVGGFDERFFAHMEEIDLCWRLWRAGYRVAAVPAAVVRHSGGGTLPPDRPEKTRLNHRNSLWMLLKNENLSTLVFTLPVRLVLDGTAALYQLAHGRWRLAAAVIRGVVAAVFGAPGMLASRTVPSDRPAATAPRRIHSLVLDYFVFRRRTYREVTPSP